MQKALLKALLTNSGKLRELQDAGNFTELMVRLEEAKMMPLSAVWNEYLERTNTVADYYGEIKKYEDTVLSARA
jgi:L-rhamnose isomerase